MRKLHAEVMCLRKVAEAAPEQAELQLDLARLVLLDIGGVHEGWQLLDALPVKLAPDERGQDACRAGLRRAAAGGAARNAAGRDRDQPGRPAHIACPKHRAVAASATLHILHDSNSGIGLAVSRLA